MVRTWQRIFADLAWLPAEVEEVAYGVARVHLLPPCRCAGVVRWIASPAHLSFLELDLGGLEELALAVCEPAVREPEASAC